MSAAVTATGPINSLREPLRMALETIAVQAETIARLRKDVAERDVYVRELQQMLSRAQ